MTTARAGTVPDDRSTRARIRDAAVACFAEHGWSGTTARKVAAGADVSPGSVIHHFGSMDDLRRACDEHVVRTVRRLKLDAIEQGEQLDVMSAMRDAPVAAIGRYLARMLTDGPAAAALVDEMVADARDYLERGVANGMIEPSEDPDARAAVVTLHGLGMLALHDHVRRLLGVDPTDPAATAEDLAAYARPVYELYDQGLLTNDAATRVRAGLAAGASATTDATNRSAPARQDDA